MDKSVLDQTFALSEEQIAFFRTNGFVKIKNVLPTDVLDYYETEITKKVVELNTLNLPMEERNTYQKAFLQICNLWRENEIVKELVFSRRLAKIAADLLGTNGVRLYHDQALYKEAGEVSFHYGWTFHNAGPNDSNTDRKVMTIIYMDEQMRLQKPANENQILDWETWCPGVKIDDVIDSELNPVLFSRKNQYHE